MTDTFLTITPLGGLGEIGMNCQMWNTPEGCVLVDCGIMFPDDQQLGVDVVIPPLEPILAQRGRLLGVVLTHGHEDHIGAVPWLVSFIKGLKVYGSPMTLALVEHKLRERGLLDRLACPLHSGEPFHPAGIRPCGGYASGKSRAYGRLQDR